MRHRTVIKRLLESEVIKGDSVDEHLKLLGDISNKYPEKKLTKAARFFKALSDPVRLKILKVLKEREMCMCKLEYIFKLSQPTVSYHLKILKDAGVINKRERGKWSIYSVADEKATRLLEEVEGML